MLVYGDPQYEARWSRLQGQLKERLLGQAGSDLDTLRAWLIEAGQLEQGLLDHWAKSPPVGPPGAERVQKLTDLLAQAFVQAWADASSSSVATCIKRALTTLEELSFPEDPLLQIKVPEGFAFYALFPEQYCATALHWAEIHRGTSPKRALVVGLRSIGTTLSAVVKASLERAGWLTDRFTVRPSGPPFARQVDLGKQNFQGLACALVVDEGPGISGSSMAATAQALAQAGLADISFLPGHRGEPGQAASAQVRRWWTSTPRLITALEALRWHGQSLAEALASQSANWIGRQQATESHLEDLSGGLWRHRVFESPAAWPAAAATFERLKFRLGTPPGPAVLWKFAGLGPALEHPGSSAESALQKSAQLAQAGWSPQPLGTFRGFLAISWVPGRPLTRTEATQDTILLLGQYLAVSAGPELSAEASQAAIARLSEMLFWNTHQALGEKWAEQTRGWADPVASAGAGASYGDGHLAPWEWRRTPAGKLVKTDSFGHDADHTLVGQQSVWWDVAGAIMEWDLAERQCPPLLCPLRENGVRVERQALSFYEAAYAAFRMGFCALAEGQTDDPAERSRLAQARDWYREKLRACLEKRD